MNKGIMRKLGFDGHVDRVGLGLCPFCVKPIQQKDFRDALSKKEFEISGICQKCQDEFFKEDKNE